MAALGDPRYDSVYVRSAFGPQQYESPSACWDCTMDCTDVCSPPGLTDQCTDQCLLPCGETITSDCQVACTAAECEMDQVLPCPWDGECAAVQEQPNCPFELHQYYSQPLVANNFNFSNNHCSPGGSWSCQPTFEDIFCGCEDPSTQSKQFPVPHPDSITPQPCPTYCNVDHPNPSAFSCYQNFPSSSMSDNSSFSTPSLSSRDSFPPTRPLAPVQTVDCHWANCSATFASTTDLVNHVNSIHLSGIALSSGSSDLRHNMGDQKVPPLNSLACMWDNCTLYPNAGSVPGTSTASNDLQAMLELLSSHLIEDHLGLHQPSVETPSPRALLSPERRPSTPVSSVSEACGSSCCDPVQQCAWEGCQETFATCEDLTNHISSVHVGTGKAKYECHWTGCDRHDAAPFSSKQKILRHIQSHTGYRPFQCELCKQNFSEAATLKQHMRRHTQEKPYICDHPGCGKAFAITGALTVHKRTHNGQKPFSCKICGRAFSESSNLSKHLRTHSGMRPYVCTVEGCAKPFSRPDQLSRHMKIHAVKNP
ncbi:hypothetical protein SISNIDRAFT_453368 [Sistotremastrum niveocremeum HHB9708]|uniref:C2H2-type domain-containing protein n=1 Tax=Sistotremastrum niveocremeum HHB9708 TaxID=1314777 RepID=A0A164VTA9_9AGAM|nr:hypothetical protein SISNIDRAFT_453368 [Sistotremastrum niveocremeum HHB9708]